MNFSIVIPTYERKEDLKNCLCSILNQSFSPSEIIIIDDGNLSEKNLNEIHQIINNKKNIIFFYYKKNHKKEQRGASESRNIAVDVVSNELFFILDDDLILEKDFFEKIMNTWRKHKKNKNLIGIGGLIKNNRRKNKIEKIYDTFFGLTSKYRWDINPVGFQVWDESIKKEEKGYYTHGGVCSYRKSLLKKVGEFTTFSGGRTANEDIDFCLRSKNMGYHFIVEPSAQVFHKQSKISRENNFLIGFKDTYNRKIIFKNHCQKNIKNYLWFFWANVGWTLRQFLAGKPMSGLGMIKGALKQQK